MMPFIITELHEWHWTFHAIAIKHIFDSCFGVSLELKCSLALMCDSCRTKLFY